MGYSACTLWVEGVHHLLILLCKVIERPENAEVGLLSTVIRRHGGTPGQTEDRQGYSWLNTSRLWRPRAYTISAYPGLHAWVGKKRGSVRTIRASRSAPSGASESRYRPAV